MFGYTKVLGFVTWTLRMLICIFLLVNLFGNFLLETRAARESVVAFSEPGDRVGLHFDSRTAAAYIRCQGGTRSNVLSQEALLL